MSILLGAGGAKNTKEIGVGVGGQVRKVKEGYVGVGGVPRIFFSAGPKPLDKYTWDDIRKIADDGMAAKYFKVGDCKGIQVRGTIGTLSIDQLLYVYILGFDHDLEHDPDAKNTIDFGTFKTTDGTDVCMVDGHYDSSSSNGARWFNMNHWGTFPEPYNTNYGGWKGCDLRYDILGSTDNAPIGYGKMATAYRTGYDASATTATAPVKNTLMAALPEDLRAVMKPMTVWTDNKGNKSNTSASVTTSIDYLPLLSEYEVFGSREYANQYEQNHQAQYAYYVAGNTRIKYRHSGAGAGVYWWGRSPYYIADSHFCDVFYSNGDKSHSYSHYSYGLAPKLRV